MPKPSALSAGREYTAQEKRDFMTSFRGGDLQALVGAVVAANTPQEAVVPVNTCVNLLCAMKVAIAAI